MTATRSVMGRGSWGAGGLPVAVALPMIAILAISVPGAAAGMETGHVGRETGLYWSRATTLQRLRQVAACIVAGQLSTGVGFIVACHGLRIGQQHLDLAIAEDAAGSDSSTAGSRPLKCSLVQRAHSLNGIACAGSAQ